MTLLVACPVILPPRDDVLASWNHRPHVCVENGSWDEWGVAHKTARDSWWAVRFQDGLGRRHNMGVAKAWNYAFANAQSNRLDYVALVSQSLVIDGGTTRLAELVDDRADERGLLTDYAWHCIVLSVAVWEQLGPFDEAFFAYYEDSDYVRRMFLAGVHTPANPMPKVTMAELPGSCENAAALKAGLIGRYVYGRSHDRFVAKWGSEPFHETYARPFDPTSVGVVSNWTLDAQAHGDPRPEALR